MSVRREGKMVRLKLSGRKLADLDFWTKSDPFLTLSRPSRNGNEFVQLRRTETMWNNLNPDWSLLYVPLCELCDEDHNMPLQIAVYDEDKGTRNDLIGTVEVTLNQLMESCNNESCFPLVREKDGIHKKKTGRGDIIVRECIIEDVGDPLRKSSGSYPERKSSASYPAPTFQQQLNSYQARPNFPAPQWSVGTHQQPPGQTPFYPAQTPGYPAQTPGYPAQTPGYPDQTAGYPTQTPLYPSLSQDGLDPSLCWVPPPTY